MTDMDNDIRAAFDQLADQAGSGRGPETAALAIARVRRQRRARARWAVAAAALVLVGAGVSSIVPAHRDDGAAAPVPARSNGLYDLPTRGSLAGDADFVAGVQDLGWSGPLGVDNAAAGPASETRRVLFAGEVPGGGRWAMVMGTIGEQQVWAWFVGPAGAAPDQLALAADPARGGASQPIAVVDSRQTLGALLVLGQPGDEAEYSPGLDREAGGALGRTFTPVPGADGVLMSTVTTPVTADAGELHVLRGGKTVADMTPTASTRLLPAPRAPRSPTGDPALFGERMKECLEPLGFTVELFGSDAYETVRTPYGPPPLSSAEQAQVQALEDRCAQQLGY